MSTRSLRARLDRLTRTNSVTEQEKAPAPDFTVDPVLAKALRDDYERLPRLYNPSPSIAEIEEERMLRARILERAKAIGCPPGYGLEQFQNDTYRLMNLASKRMSPPPYGGPLKDADDAEEAQLRARVTTYPDGPDAHGRKRRAELHCIKDSERTAAEQTELDSLMLAHPEPPPDPNYAVARSMAHNWDVAIEQSEERHRMWLEERQRLAEMKMASRSDD